MKVFNAYEPIIIGARIRYLINIEPNAIVSVVLDQINGLERGLLEVDFKVSTSFIDEYFRGIFKELQLKDDKKTIGDKLAKDISKEAVAFEKTLLSEALVKKLYSVPERRYNSLYLADQPHKLLKNGLFEKLTEIAASDFVSSCRCLLYGEATASAFHILRSTEEVLKGYYFKHIKSNRLKSRQLMWGNMTTALKAKKINKPSEVILNSLDLVRISYRNPTQHPSLVYDIESAQDLFGVCIDLINKMAIEL